MVDKIHPGLVAIVGIVTTMFGVIDQSTWATVSGAAIGVSGVAWVWGVWVRDKAFMFLKQQNQELVQQGQELSSEVASLKSILRNQDVKDEEVGAAVWEAKDKATDAHTRIHELQDRLANVIPERDRLRQERDHWIARNDQLFDQVRELTRRLDELTRRAEQ